VDHSDIIYGSFGAHYTIKLYFLDKDNEYVIEKKNFVKVTFYTL